MKLYFLRLTVVLAIFALSACTTDQYGFEPTDTVVVDQSINETPPLPDSDTLPSESNETDTNDVDTDGPDINATGPDEDHTTGSGPSTSGSGSSTGSGSTGTTTTPDTDGDGVDDSHDNCINIKNPNQGDYDGDGIGNICDPDADNDGILNDGDGSGKFWDNLCTGGNTTNCDDNCVIKANANQVDSDGDHFGDACDPTPNGADSDNDGILDASDICPNFPNPAQTDMDGDGIGDFCDPDVDGDGILNDGDGSGKFWDNKCSGGNTTNCDDNCLIVANPTQADSDNDAKGDDCDGSIATPSTTCTAGFTTYYLDNDNDLYGDKNATVANGNEAEVCNSDPSPTGWVTNKDDCNDNNASINPGADDPSDPGDGIDNDCDGSIDEDINFRPGVGNPGPINPGVLCQIFPETCETDITESGGVLFRGFHMDLDHSNDENIYCELNEFSYKAVNVVSTTDADGEATVTFDAIKTVYADNKHVGGKDPDNASDHTVRYSVIKTDDKKVKFAITSITDTKSYSSSLSAHLSPPSKTIDVNSLGLSGFDYYAVLLRGFDLDYDSSSKYAKFKNMHVNIYVDSAQQYSNYNMVGTADANGKLKVFHAVDFYGANKAKFDYKIYLTVIGFNYNDVAIGKTEAYTQSMPNTYKDVVKAVTLSGSSDVSTGDSYLIGMNRLQVSNSDAEAVDSISYAVFTDGDKVHNGNKANVHIKTMSNAKNNDTFDSTADIFVMAFPDSTQSWLTHTSKDFSGPSHDEASITK